MHVFASFTLHNSTWKPSPYFLETHVRRPIVEEKLSKRSFDSAEGLSRVFVQPFLRAARCITLRRGRGTFHAANPAGFPWEA